MIKPRARKIAGGLAVSWLVFVVDYLSKWFLIEMVGLPGRPPIEVNSIFNLAAVWNKGVSFGMFSEYNQPYILVALSTIIIVILLLWLTRSESRFLSVALGLVIGGAAGNVLDRLRFGKVFDFLDFHIGQWHWPAFNIADSAIFIGVVLLCIHSMFIDKELKR